MDFESRQSQLNENTGSTGEVDVFAFTRSL